MSDDPLHGLDGPTLLALSSLLESASVTGAARTLGRTQSSMSRTLARLREVFDDPLLLPVGRSMRPTSRGRALRAPVARALESLRGLFTSARPVSPRDQQRTVKIAAADYASVVLLDGWIANLRRTAPGVIVNVMPVDAGSIEPLARGEIDLAVAPFLPGVGLDQFVVRKLIVDRYVCALRSGHPELKRKLGLAGYLALDHVMVGSVLPTVSTIDEALHRLGVSRKIGTRMPSVVSALMLVAHSNLAATSFERIVPFFGGRLVARPLPFELPPFELSLMWHPRENDEPFHRWIRESLLRHAAAVTTTAGKRTPR